MHHEIEIPPEHRPRSNTRQYQATEPTDDQCPLQFSLGLSRRAHTPPTANAMAIVEPPVVYPVHPSYGPGRQVIHTTQYEHLDVLSPLQITEPSTIIKEGLAQQQDFPLLFESSSFLAAPIVHDFNADGIPDALLTDYDGGMYFVGLQVGKNNHRYFHRSQIPRLYIRREWMESRLNMTKEESTEGEEGRNESNNDDADNAYNHNDPFHSYFEYGTQDNNPGEILRGVTANLLGQENENLKGLEERRKRRVKHEKVPVDEASDERAEGNTDLLETEEEVGEEWDAGEHRRLEQVHTEEEDGSGVEHTEGTEEEYTHDEGYELDGNYDRSGEAGDWGDDDGAGGTWDDAVIHGQGEGQDDDAYTEEGEGELDAEADYDGEDHPEYGEGHDDMADYPYYDDYYGHRYKDTHEDYYDQKHYIRLPPHVLCTPVLAEMKKAYANDENEREEMVFVAVSYYFDEDEYEGFFSYKRFENTDAGDETEIERGMHVASAIVAYVMDDSMRFGREEHLDLSTDATAPIDATMIQHPVSDTRLGAFALGTPTVADIDSNGDEDILLGTSMGIVYCMHARHLYTQEGWPVQVRYPIESRILVEDVMGNTNLEIFVSDIGGNVYCFDVNGNLLWHRDVLEAVSPGSDLRGSSPMTLGDVNGDGKMDLVIVLKILSSQIKWSTFVVVLSALTGDDIPNFPIEFDSPLLVDDGSGDALLHQKLPQPLLVDLHADQQHWQQYMNRNGTEWDPPSKTFDTPPHGGSAPGLHIVQPVGTNVVIMEGGSGCTQMITIGEEVAAMVQADDVHGTNNLDLVVSTRAGNILTLESPVVPYHPLNVWNTGEVRSRRNNHAQGFTASQGIFVRSVSRRYRDIFGVFVPVTFEIFDNRPGIADEPEKRIYKVDVRDGTSARRTLLRKTFTEPGVYTERVYISYGPGYYALSVVLRTTHGLIYEDVFHLGYNVHYMDGMGVLLWLPLFISSSLILFCSKKKAHWDDDDYDSDARGQRQGILGRT